MGVKKGSPYKELIIFEESWLRGTGVRRGGGGFYCFFNNGCSLSGLNYQREGEMEDHP